MSKENAEAFLAELLEGEGHSPDLMSKIGTDFKKEHMAEALKARGTSKEELLKKAAGGWHATTTLAIAGTGAATAAAAA